MSTRRPLTVAALAVGALLLTAAPAWAHAAFDVQQLPAGATEEFELRVPIEIGSTNAFVDVLLPSGWVLEDCVGAEGWTCDSEQRDTGETVVNLARDDDAAGGTELFTLSMTAPAQQGSYAFPVVQTYEDGTEAAWIGEEGSDRPTPVVQVGDDDTPVERSSELPSHDAEDDPAATSSDAEPTDDASASGDDGDGSDASVTDEPSSEEELPSESASEEQSPVEDPAAERDEGLSPALIAVGVLIVVGIGGAAYAAQRDRRR